MFPVDDPGQVHHQLVSREFLPLERRQKERMIPYGETTSPRFSSQRQSDEPCTRYTHVIWHRLLTVKQLKEKELEGDRLREQLEPTAPGTQLAHSTLTNWTAIKTA